MLKSTQTVTISPEVVFRYNCKVSLQKYIKLGSKGKLGDGKGNGESYTLMGEIPLLLVIQFCTQVCVGFCTQPKCVVCTQILYGGIVLAIRKSPFGAFVVEPLFGNEVPRIDKVV